MHMADALISPAVGGAFWALSAGALGYSAIKIKRDAGGIGENGGGENAEGMGKKVSLMAVSGAFIFAAQMINFTIPATGSSGHIGGGVLLACLLGTYPALLTVASVLIAQALFFADGGLLALGCNIFNMGVIPCLFVYPLIVKPLFQKARGPVLKKYAPGCVLGVMIGLPLGAFFVVLQTLASGITALPFSVFALLMIPIHLAIALGEALVTAAVVGFVAANSPEIMGSALSGGRTGKAGAFKRVLAVLGICALLTGGLLSVFASGYPDGLEWSIEKITGSADLETAGAVFERAAKIQDAAAFMPDYDFRAAGEEVAGGAAGTTVAGITGSLITCALAGALGAALYLFRRKKTGQRTA
jgi:cobalt/nickel transport system permease protein